MTAWNFAAGRMENTSPTLLIDEVRLRACLGEAHDRFAITALAECPSTNTFLLRRNAEGAPSGSVVVCDRQSAGRGSRGRNWIARPDASLTFSLLRHFKHDLARLSGLSLAVGVAVVRALTACDASGATLKWPNDILFRDAKLGGILVELAGQADRAQAVIGIGLNLLPPAMETHGEGLMMPATSIEAMLSPLPDRHFLLARLLIELAQTLDRFAETGFAGLRDEWLSCHAWQGRAVRVLRDGKTVLAGVCQGADAEGALLVQTAAGVERCLSGDVSLRALP